MKQFNNITMLPVVCPVCGHENPEKYIVFQETDGLDERETIEKEAMLCDKCGFDNYTHIKMELDKEI